MIVPPYELVSFAIVILLQVVGLSFTAWLLLKSSKSGPMSLLLEKDGVNSGNISFSRVAGTLGALTLTSLFVANVFWVHHAMFNGGTLDGVEDLWPVYVFGSALFAPYAFNRLATIGRKNTTSGNAPHDPDGQ